MSINKFMIEGLDRLGKDTLIGGIQHRRGYHQVLHFSKPVQLECYTPAEAGDPIESKREALFRYQEASFRTMFSLMRDATYSHIICNRAHLGENVYAPMYRGYDGSYVFGLERSFRMDQVQNLRLILLTEDFDIAEELCSGIVDDGESFDFTKRRQEQELFLAAFDNSIIRDKRIICVTDRGLGGFKPKHWILDEVLG
jgi:thymidylate kinase